jgi:hypothetical protein
MHCVEFGCGGSTLFISKRCEKLLSMDNNLDWIYKVQQALSEQRIYNANLLPVKDIKECGLYVGKQHFDLALVDCCDLDRVALVKWMKDVSDVIVLDNYDSPYARGTDIFFDSTWKIESFDDCHWVGKGTKIYSKKC